MTPPPVCFPCSRAGEGGLEAHAENAAAGRVPLARGGGRARGGVPVVVTAVEPPEDAGGYEKPAQ